MKNIYLDYAATTPCDHKVAALMAKLSVEDFANSNSPHRLGQHARKLLEDARSTIAQALNATANEIVFTSGGSEANNYVIQGIVNRCGQGPCHIVACSIEHHSVLEPLQLLLNHKQVTVTWVGPDAQGLIPLASIEQALSEHTQLVIVHHANNQIGVIEPIEEIGVLCRARGVLLLVDAVQTVGHIPVDVRALNADFLTFSAHKFYGPLGIGGLFIRKGCDLPSLILGGDQERGRRAGTVNMPAAAGMALALTIALNRLNENRVSDETFRRKIINYLLQNIAGTRLNGHDTKRLPNNVNVSFEGIDSEQLITALDLSGIAVSMGSACTAGRLTPSHVLKSIGLSDALALGALRVTLGRFTTDTDVDYFLEQTVLKVKQLRR